MDIRYCVPCLLGLEGLIADELREMGAADVCADGAGGVEQAVGRYAPADGAAVARRALIDEAARGLVGDLGVRRSESERRGEECGE